jgi:3-oxoacyl-[acyl-carrier protein] reductase
MPPPMASIKDQHMPTEQRGSAIVTGASRGIGAAVAARLARDGYQVTVNFAAGEQAARAVVTAIEAAGGSAVAVQADVSDPAAVAHLFDEAARAHGPLRALVSNAGLGLARPTPVAEIDDETFDRMMRVNARGVFNTLREAARRIADGGRIVTVSSTTAHFVLPGYAAYSASKLAVEGMTRILAAEMRGRSVTVNAVAPGPIATEMFLAGKPQEFVDEVAMMAPLQRIGHPDDVAGVIGMLLGADGGWINGQVILANGGMA